MTTHPAVQRSNSKSHSSQIWRLGLVALVATLLVSYAHFSAPRASAASLQTVGETNSYYVDNAMYNLGGGNLYTAASVDGTNEANHDNGSIPSACSNGQYTVYTIIDFGQPLGSTIQPWINIPALNWSQVGGITLAYANSWFNTSFNCFRLHLVIGMNNDVCLNWGSTHNTDPCVATSATSLATTVEAANSSLASSGESWQIDVSGGLDAETDKGFGSYSTTLGFVNAYTTKVNTYTTKYQLYDFGDATHSCNLDWSCPDPTGQIYNIAWNIGYDYPFPEAYSFGQNSNWQEVSGYSSSNPIRYRVALMDGSSSFCPSTGACWQDFLNKNGYRLESSVLAGSIQQPM